MDKQKKIEEILELAAIPGVADFLFTAVEQVKEKFEDHIRQYREAKEAYLPDLDELSTDKSYFFDINYLKYPGEETGSRWVVENFKFKDKPALIAFIFSGFIKKIDRFELDPQKIKTEVLKLSTGIFVEINYKKTSDSHVGGFVKKFADRREKARGEKQRLNESHVIKIPGKYKEMNKEEMYRRIIQLMDEDSEFRELIFFYYQMVKKSKK